MGKEYVTLGKKYPNIQRLLKRTNTEKKEISSTGINEVFENNKRQGKRIIRNNDTLDQIRSEIRRLGI